MSNPEQPGLSDLNEVARYSQEQCHYFALALADLSGLQLVYIANRNDGGELTVGHVACRINNDEIVDAEGFWSEDAILDAWRSNSIEAASAEDIYRHLEDDDGDLSSYVIGEVERAKRLLEEDESDFLARVRGAVPSSPTL